MLIDGHVHVNNFYRKRGRLEEMADKYVEHGFDAIITTDHFKKKDFEEGRTMDRYWEPFRQLLKMNKFEVFPGAEVNVADTDVLVYGISITHYKPIIDITSIPELTEYVHSKNGITIQAHPYRSKRGKFRIIVSDDVDGYEINMHPKHESNNDKTYSLLGETGKAYTSGSDAHNIHAVGCGGMILPCNAAYNQIMECIKNKQVTIL